MYCVEITDRSGSMRALTEREVALVAGGNWADAVLTVFRLAAAISPLIGMCVTTGEILGQDFSGG
jgi:hypothetical protein